MNKNDVIQNIADALRVPVTSLNEETREGDLEQWDSVGTMTIMAMLDSKYGLRLNPGDAASLLSLSGILQLLEKRGTSTPLATG